MTERSFQYDQYLYQSVFNKSQKGTKIRGFTVGYKRGGKLQILSQKNVIKDKERDAKRQ